MKNMFRYKYLLVFAAVFSGFSGSVLAQQAGEVKDQEFVIRKDRVLTLPKQPRKFERIPVLPTAKVNSSFNYEVRPYFLSLAPEIIQPSVAQKQWPRTNEELFPGFARLGFGNYASPLIEVRYNNWEEGDYNFGASVKHEGYYRGPIDGSNSGENFTNVKLNGNLFKDFFQLYGGVDYNRHQFNFYGYDPENPALQEYIPSQNILNTFRLTGGIQDIEKMDNFNYDVNLNLRAFNDNYEVSETEFAIKGFGDFWFDDYIKTGINSELSLTRPKDLLYTDINRNYFKVNPYVAYQKSGLKVQAGANMVIENDVTLNKKSDFHIYPQLYAHYMIQDEFGVYAGFEGDVLRKTYLDFVTENPFLGPSDQLLNTIQNYLAKAGVKGTINDEMTYEAGASYGKFRNMHFFGNSQADSLRFNLLYDDDTKVLNYNAKVGWNYEKTYRLIASVDYYYYTTKTLAAAFQRPEWVVSINNNFTPTDKWLIQFNANAMGGIKGFVRDALIEEDMATDLPIILDLQLKADYQITDRFSVFAIGNNLLNRKNQRFMNYPVRGIQGIAGLTFKF